MKIHFWTILKTAIPLLHLYFLQFMYFSLNEIHLKIYLRCISIMSCSQTRPGICSQTRLEISLCSLSGLSLQGRGQFLVLLNQSEQDQESLSALSLDCLCQTGLTTWSVNFPIHKIILQILPLCKIMLLGPVGALISGLEQTAGNSSNNLYYLRFRKTVVLIFF